MSSSRFSQGFLRGFPLLLLGGASAAAVACAEEFSSCEDRAICRPDGDPDGSSEAGAGGEPTTDGAGGETDGASSSGAGGADGSGGAAPTGPAEGEACEEDGIIVCVAQGGSGRLECSGGAWERSDCDADSVCIADSAECAPIAPGCEELAPGGAFCDGDTRRVCGPDRTSTSDEPCSGSCDEAGCIDASCGDGEVQEGEACDDGNEVAGDGCSLCGWEPIGVKAMGDHTCAWFEDGRLKCWGRNDYRQLGFGVDNIGDEPDEMGAALPALEQLTHVTDVAGSLYSTCALNDGELWCWGANDVGQGALGNTRTNPVPRRVPLPAARTFTAIAAGPSDNFCAWSAASTPLCWGRNSYGQTCAGLGPILSVDSPYLNIGDDPGEIELNPGPNLRGVASVGTGQRFDCAVANGNVHCWGSNQGGLLASADLDYYGDSPGEFNPPAIAMGRSFVPVAVVGGDLHACALSSTGAVKCWGANASGQLGYENTVPVSGWEVASQRTVDLAGRAKELAAGEEFTCALLDDGSVKCWGYQGSGVLGRPEATAVLGSIGNAAGEMGTALDPVYLGSPARSISAGSSHVCVLLETSAIKCWGSNDSGQLGLGHASVAVGDDPGEMLNLPAVSLD